MQLGLTLSLMARLRGGTASPPATVPSQFGTGDWSIADRATSGEATVTITALPNDGGSVLLGVEYQVDGGAWTALGGPSVGTYYITGLTNGVAAAVALRAVNGVGNGTASATKNVTTTAASSYVFGALTLGGAGGVPVPVGATSITGGTATGYTITGGYVVPSSDGSATAGTLTFNTGGPWTVTTEAGVYSCRQTSELTAAIAAAELSPTADRIAKLRSGTYGAVTFTNRNWSGTESGVPVSAFTESERGGTWNPAYSGGSFVVTSHTGVASDVKFNAGVTLTSSDGIVFRLVTIGKLTSGAQYSYEPEQGVLEQVNITGITLGNPTVITHSGGAPQKIRVGAKMDIATVVGTTALNSGHYTVLATNGSTSTTLDVDTTAEAAWVSGGIMYGAIQTSYLTASVAFTPDTASTFIMDRVDFSNYALSTDPQYWGDLTTQGSFKRGVFYRCNFDGYYNALKIGQGYQSILYGCKFQRGLADYIAIRSTTTATAAAYATTKNITNITQANPGVVTCTAHGLEVGDSVKFASVGGMTQANIKHYVYSVIDANTFTLGQLRTSSSQGIDPTDTTGWTAYTSGGTTTGALFANVWIENCWAGPQAGSAYFTAPHSDGVQAGASTNEINTRGCILDCVFAPTIDWDEPNATQPAFFDGGNIDSTYFDLTIKNVMLTGSAPNQFIAPQSRDWKTNVAFFTADRRAGAYFATTSDHGIVQTPWADSLVTGCIGYNFSGNGITTGCFEGLTATLTRTSVFTGPFETNWRGDAVALPRPVGMALAGDARAVEDIIQEWADTYKTVGAYAGMGFGGDPDGIYFTGSADVTAPTISAVSSTPTSNTTTVDYSVNEAAGHVYWWISTTGGVSSAATIIANAKAAYSAASGTGSVVGLSASGAQTQLSISGLSPATNYSVYLVAVDWHGNTSSVTEHTLTTAALTKPVIQQAINVLSTTTSQSTNTSSSVTVGSTADTILFAVLTFSAAANTTDYTGTTVTWNGAAMTLKASFDLAGTSPAKRSRAAIYALANPTPGTGTIVAAMKNAGAVAQNTIACVIDALEVSNCDTNLANIVAATGARLSSGTSISTTLTTTADDALIITGVTIFGGPTSAWAATNGGTLTLSTQTGTSGSNDNVGLTITEDAPTAGANGNGASWTTSVEACITSLAVNPA